MAMVSQNYNLSLVSFLLCFLFFLIINPNPAMSDDVQTKIDFICRKMEEYGFCNTVFNQNVKDRNTDYVGLTEIATQQAILNATDTHDFIAMLLPSITQPELKNILTICESGYRVVLQALQDGYRKFLDKDYVGMQGSEGVAPKAEGGCDQAMAFHKAPPTDPLNERNREMRILIAMTLVTGYQLVPKTAG